MWLVFALFAFDVDGIAPVSFGKIQEFVDGFDVGDAVGHGSTSKRKKAGSSFRLSDRTAPGFGLLIVDPVKQAFHAMGFALMRYLLVLTASVRPTP